MRTDPVAYAIHVSRNREVDQEASCSARSGITSFSATTLICRRIINMHVVQRLHSSCRSRSANRDSAIKPSALDPLIITGRALDARIMCSDGFNQLLALLTKKHVAIPCQNPAIIILDAKPLHLGPTMSVEGLLGSSRVFGNGVHRCYNSTNIVSLSSLKPRASSRAPSRTNFVDLRDLFLLWNKQTRKVNKC